MAPIYRGDTEVLTGQLKIGNQDVKEVYLGSEKIWPPKIIYPDPVNRFFWKQYGSNNAEDIGLVDSVSPRFTKKPNVPSGSPNNLDSSKSEVSTYIYTNRFCQFKQTVYKVDNSNRLYWQNSRAKFTFDMKKWKLLDTDFNCKLKLVSSQLGFVGEHYWSTSAVYNNVHFDGYRVMQCQSYYSYPTVVNNITWTGTAGYNEKTWVSEKTIAEYFEENDGLVEVDFTWAVNSDDGDAAATRFAFGEAGSAFSIYFNFEEISFTTEEPDSEKPEFHRCSNPRHVGNMKSDQPVFRDNYRITIGSENNTVRIWEFDTTPDIYLVKAPYVGYGHKEGNRDETNRFYFWGCTSGSDANQLAAQLNDDDLKELHVNGVSIDLYGLAYRGAWKAFQGSVLGGGVAWGVYIDIPNTLSAVWDAKYQGANYIGLTP